MKRETVISSDRKFRYRLWREFGGDFLFDGGNKMKDGFVNFIGLNPSTADENIDDPTIRRCIGFAKSWGYGSICMTNLFPYRATKPDAMKQALNPTGENNQYHLLQCASEAGIVIAAWGIHGTFRNQDITVRNWMFQAGIKLHCLGQTRSGSPKHPLYLSANIQPSPYMPWLRLFLCHL